MEKSTCEINIFNLDEDRVINETITFDSAKLMQYREDFYLFDDNQADMDQQVDFELKDGQNIKVVPNKLAELVNALVTLNSEKAIMNSANENLIPVNLAEDGITLKNLLKTGNLDIVNSLIIGDILRFTPTNKEEKLLHKKVVSNIIFKESRKLNAKEDLENKLVRVAELNPDVFPKVSKDTEAFYALYHIDLGVKKFKTDKFRNSLIKLENFLPKVKILPNKTKTPSKM